MGEPSPRRVEAIIICILQDRRRCDEIAADGHTGFKRG
jgi:hypothetical protein